MRTSNFTGVLIGFAMLLTANAFAASKGSMQVQSPVMVGDMREHRPAFSEMLVGGGAHSDIFRWLTGVVRTLLPQLLKSGVITEEEVDIDTLEERLRRGAMETNAQVYSPPNICAWTTV